MKNMHQEDLDGIRKVVQDNKAILLVLLAGFVSLVGSSYYRSYSKEICPYAVFLSAGFSLVIAILYTFSITFFVFIRRKSDLKKRRALYRICKIFIILFIFVIFLVFAKTILPISNNSVRFILHFMFTTFLLVIGIHACLIFYKKKYNKLKGIAQKILFFMLISGALFSSGAHFAYVAGERDAKNKLNYNKQNGYEIKCNPRGEIEYEKLGSKGK